MIPFIVTDFGYVSVPEGDWPTKRCHETRYDEFEGFPYTITYEAPDYSGPEGKKWKAYEDYVVALAEKAYLRGDAVSELVVEPFSEWAKGL